MLVVISPAKRLDWAERAIAPTEPAYQADALRLAKTARNLTLRDLRKLMDLSDDLARLNRDWFKAFAADPAPEITRPAALAFAGDTYMGLDAPSLSQDAIDWAQDHLRILSGLYGLLRPLDAIQPYRLEMGSRLKTRRGTSLYAYWGDQLAKALNAQAEVQGSDTLINCASQEYFGAVDRKRLALRVVTPAFFELKDGEPRMISFFAKKARGSMARYIVENRITDPEALKAFDVEGYRFDPGTSQGEQMSFIRSAVQAPLKEAS